ncbi:MAG TPA: MFS transporter [Miltoncostaeaceae bacterium]|nr:MFS transporter [Miltoncostaeaceae bacterium]
MSPRVATTGLFVVNGAVIGVWVSQIPWIQERFGLSSVQVGLMILCMSLAVIVAVPIAGQAVARRGSGPVAVAGGAACVVAVNLPVLAPQALLTAGALVLLGGASAAMDVAMNSHGVHIETAGGRPIMSSLHAGWALGGAAGAGLGALGAALGVDGRVTVAITAALLGLLLAVCAPRLGPGSAAEGEGAAPFTLPSRGVALLAALCLLVMMTEGAMADWSGILMANDLGASAALAALAYAVFTSGMTVGRLVGDGLNRRIGPVWLLRGGAVLTAVPLAVMLLAGSAQVALAALFLVGLGVANGVPLMFSAAGRQPGTAPGPGIAAVSSTGSIGFLLGPPLIGFLAGAMTLPWALGVLVPAAVAVGLLARRAAGPRPGARRAPSGATVMGAG